MCLKTLKFSSFYMKYLMMILLFTVLSSSAVLSGDIVRITVYLTSHWMEHDFSVIEKQETDFLSLSSLSVSSITLWTPFSDLSIRFSISESESVFSCNIYQFLYFNIRPSPTVGIKVEKPSDWREPDFSLRESESLNRPPNHIGWCVWFVSYPIYLPLLSFLFS